MDSVLAIRKGLTEHQNKDNPSPAVTPQPSPLAQPTSDPMNQSLKIPVLNQADVQDDRLHIKPESIL